MTGWLIRVHRPREGLSANADFVRLWIGETISLVGSQVTALALPMAALLTLKASPAALGLLGSARYLPFLLLSLPAGLVIDRLARRRIMLVANLGRAAALAYVPIAYALGSLRIEELVAVAFVVGCLTVFFDLTWQSYVPSVVEREQLTQANSRLMGSSYVAEVGGPGLAGVLIQVLTAPVAILVDALSFLVSALTIQSIRKPEEPPAREQAAERRSLWRDLGEGVGFVARNTYLRAIGLQAATSNLLGQAIFTVFLIYAVRTLGLSASALGLVLAATSVGALLAAMTVGRLTSRIPYGRLIGGSMVLYCSVPIAVPLAGDELRVAVPVTAAAFFVFGYGIAMSSIVVVSLRQTITPSAVLGRVNASYRTLVTGMTVFGPLVGGILAQWVGTREALFALTGALVFAPLWVLLSPVRTLRELPVPDESQ